MLDEKTEEFCKKTPAPTPSPTTPAPTPVPTAPTPAPTKTFDTVLAGKADTMVWAKYGSDQPEGNTLFGYDTGRGALRFRVLDFIVVVAVFCCWRCFLLFSLASFAALRRDACVLAPHCTLFGFYHLVFFPHHFASVFVFRGEIEEVRQHGQRQGFALRRRPESPRLSL